MDKLYYSIVSSVSRFFCFVLSLFLFFIENLHTHLLFFYTVSEFCEIINCSDFMKYYNNQHVCYVIAENIGAGELSGEDLTRWIEYVP